MKFGKNSPRLFSRISCDLAPLPYNNLKQSMRKMAPDEFFTHFGTIIQKMDAEWLRAVRRMRIFFVYAFWNHAEKVHNLLAYAHLCREGVRKLLKKFNKKHPSQRWVLNRSLHFVSSLILERLSDFAVARPPLVPAESDCPVCLQSHAYVINMLCGHSFCVCCYKRLNTMCKHMVTSPVAKCPICRQPLIPSSGRGHENSGNDKLTSSNTT